MATGADREADVGRGILGQRVDGPMGRDRPHSRFRPAGRSRRPRPGGAPAKGSPCCWDRVRSAARGGRHRAGRLMGHAARRRRRRASGVSDVGAEIDTFVVTGSHLAVWAWTPGASRLDAVRRPSPCRFRTARRADRQRYDPTSEGGTSTCSCRRCGKSHPWVASPCSSASRYEMGLRWLAHRQTPEHRRQTRQAELGLLCRSPRSDPWLPRVRSSGGACSG